MDNWITSQGLDVDMSIFGSKNEYPIQVSWAGITGDFLSYQKEDNLLSFSTPIVDNIFDLLDKGAEEARIKIKNNIHIIRWESYNYSIVVSGSSIIISVGDCK